MTFAQIFEIVKMALNLGLVFLDIVASLKDIYEDLMEKFISKYSEAPAEA
jgi:hypothetical protein